MPEESYLSSAERTAAQALRDLEWPELLHAVASHAAGELGRAEIRRLGPCANRQDVLSRQALLGELLSLAERGATLPARDVADVSETLERVRRGGGASGQELVLVLGVLRTAVGLSQFAVSHRQSAPQLERAMAVDPKVGGACRSLDMALSGDGQVLDQASAALAQARASIRTLRRRVQTRIGELLLRYRDVLQDGYYAERDGRYVLPVRADAPYRVEGFVLGSSASGSTLYVEPRELHQLGHELRMAEVRAEREEALVLGALCGALIPLVDEGLWAVELCGRADLLSALCAFSRRIAARVIPLAESQDLKLVRVRHPLLVDAGVQVVENDLCLTAGRGLVVSGPNAGGKTVALKCLGLCAVMQAAGLPLPVADGSVVGFWPTVLADIGDDQSLSRSLSTFSGHVQRVCEFLALAQSNTVVLLDELMGGTDPSEGTVLAIAALEEFLRRGAAVLVTTHYEGLKERATRDPLLESGSVGFDFAAMQPTFRLELGRPGASSALAVAARHGLPAPVIARAEALLPEVDAQVRRDRIQVEQLRADLEREQQALQKARREQIHLNLRQEEELRRQEDARRRDLGRESDELRVAVREARTELKALRLRMKSVDLGTSLRDLERGIDQVSSQVALGSGVDRALRGPGDSNSAEPKAASSVANAVAALTPGARVRLRGMSGTGEVLEPPRKGKVTVRIGAMKVTVATEELELLGGVGAGRATERHRSGGKQLVPSGPAELPAPVRAQDVVLDLRGRRVDEALDEVDVFVDGLLRRQEPGAYVLHGHGTGALKDAVRAHLAGHPCVLVSRPAERDEGGDALTVLWLVS